LVLTSQPANQPTNQPTNNSFVYLSLSQFLQQEKRKLTPGTLANHVGSLLYALKFLHRDSAPKYDGVVIIQQLQRQGTFFFKEGESQRADSLEELELQGRWLSW
jgi:hypothetical protein